MRFEEALKAMREGKKVKNSAYNYIYAIIDNDVCMSNINHFNIMNNLGSWREAEIYSDELLAEDWEVVND